MPIVVISNRVEKKERARMRNVKFPGKVTEVRNCAFGVEVARL
jgi:hypothetical protein